MLCLRAPAKVNLYLKVLGRRSDGYHELETLFERIDLIDELAFERHPGEVRLTCTDASLSCGYDNLVLQAARLLRQVGGVSSGASIRLTKRIPISAGLGGGSSDAATALVGLNRLWELGFTRGQLIQVAEQLGSDIPFFLGGAPFAIGTGRGERCRPLAGACKLAHVLVVPEERLSTRAVYEGFDLALGRATGDCSTPGRGPSAQDRSPHPSATAQDRMPGGNGGFDLTACAPSITMLAHALHNGSPSELAKGLWNDLEPEAIRRCPVIGVIQSHLRALGCLGTLVSGSGSSVFGLCADLAQAHEVAEHVRQQANPSWRIAVVQTEAVLGLNGGRRPIPSRKR